jgi:hypothetical protein
MNAETDRPGRPPRHEALWPTDLFEQGIGRGLGWVIVARFKSGGRRVEAGVFLVDMHCLGAKLAIYESCDVEFYRKQIRGHYEAEFSMTTVEPSCARKLVEESVQYAQGLGFAPHPDYKKAARVFGGITAAQCDRQFTFEFEGKPFYHRGPRETEEQARRIILHLERRCGQGNFHYLVPVGDAEEITRAFEQSD